MAVPQSQDEHNHLNADRLTSSNAEELQKVRWRLLHASGAVTHPDPHNCSKFAYSLISPVFSPVRARQKRHDLTTLRKP